MKTIMPPIVLIGATGSGRTTVARILKDLAGYREVRRTTVGTENAGLRYTVTELADDVCVRNLRTKGFTVLYVYATQSDRINRLRAAGRLAVGEECPDDHGPTELADHSIANIGTIDELREEVADLLTRIQS